MSGSRNKNLKNSHFLSEKSCTFQNKFGKLFFQRSEKISIFVTSKRLKH